MKIAIFHELPLGGARIATNEIAKRLKKEHVVDLFYVDEKKSLTEENFYSSSYFYKFIPKVWLGNDWKVRLYKDTIELYKLFILHKKIARDINESGYDVVFVNASKYIESPFLLKLSHITKVFYLHDPHDRIVYEEDLHRIKEVDLLRSFYGRLVRIMRKVIDKRNLSGADLYLANSKFTQEMFNKTYGKDSTVSYLGVDTNFFAPKNVKKKYDLLYIGSYEPMDGYLLFEEAVGLMDVKPNVKKVLFEEKWLSNKGMRDLYRKSKIVLALSHNEPFGLIPLEAMACGVPVIALDEGGYRETVIDGITGYLIKKDPEDLAKKLDYLLSEKNVQLKMKKNARNHAVDSWIWEDSTKKLERNLQQAVNLKKPTGSKGIVNKKILIFVCIFIFSIVLRIWNLNQIGRTWDEEIYADVGYKLIELVKKGDFNNSYFYSTYDHPPLVKYVYGIVANFDVEKIMPDGKSVLKYDLTYSRILSAFIFSLGVVWTALVGWKYISPVVGIISGIILAMLPFSLGLSQLVTAESFKIFIYPLAFYSYMILLRDYSLKKIVFAGVITGVALQIKQSNILLILTLGVMFFIQYLLNKREESTRFVKKKAITILLIGFISFIVFVLIWPQLIFHLPQVYEINKELWGVQFSPKIWQITLSPPEIFFGRLMLTPTFYYVVYFLISIPAIILGFFFLGIKRIFSKKDLVLYSLIIWFSIPFLMSFYSWRQHGLRYVIEIYPAICLIAAIGFDSIVSKFTKSTKIKLFCIIPVVLYLFIVLWQIKPYYLDYFNELAGGTNTVYKYRLFQQGWWGQGIREAGLYVKDVAPKYSRIGYALSPDNTLPRFDNLKYEKWSKGKNYDYVIVNYYNIIREGFDDTEIKRKYNLVYEVKADQAVLVYVYKRR